MNQPRPLILLSNDDGIASPYLTALADALEEGTGAEVLVIAPEKQRSAMSHTITLHKPLRVQAHAPGRYAASGSPVDCVYLGVMRLCPRAPALVVSGINDGYNLGTDIFYSGTVGAALEGGLRGAPAMAVSLQHGKAEALGKAVEVSVGLARALLERPPAPGVVFNVNVPAGPERRYRMTRLGRRFYRDDVLERHDPRGRAYYWIGGGEAGMEEVAGSDCEAIQAGLTSVTPLCLDLTATSLLGEGAPRLDISGFEPAP
ncbi:MAG TPA: 5'/3'-nucleotidase SurE [Kofleriaceae bacterium]|nr:5'/3'-nucleotidase SurE [Kofleriaceae bacterium]